MTVEKFKGEIVQHIVRNLLEIQLLRIIGAEATWGYRIKKQFEADFGIKLRHGALYPALNGLEQRGLVASTRQRKAGRARKVYTLTEDGRLFLQAYYGILQAQLNGADARAVGCNPS